MRDYAEDTREDPDLCDNCIDEEMPKCESCGERYDPEKQDADNEVYAEDVCPACFEEYWRKCRKCQSFYDNEDTTNDSETVCDDCYDKITDEVRDLLSPYDISPDDIDY
jgi:hypothetical protein